MREKIILFAIIVICCSCASAPSSRQDSVDLESTFIAGKLISSTGNIEEAAAKSSIVLKFKNHRTDREHVIITRGNGLFFAGLQDEGLYELISINHYPLSAYIFEISRNKVNNLGTIHWINDQTEELEFIDNYEEVQTEFLERIVRLREKEWVVAKLYTGDDAIMLQEIHGTERKPKKIPDEPEDRSNLDAFVFLNFTNYEWPFAGTTFGLGIAYNYELVSGFLVPGLSLSADVHPKTFARIAKYLGVGILNHIFNTDLSSDDDDDDDDDDEPGEDYPWRGNFVIKVFNDLNFKGLVLRPFFGWIILSYSYHGLSASAFSWITGAEAILFDTGLGIEFAYLPATSSSNRRAGKTWFRIAIAYHL